MNVYVMLTVDLNRGVSEESREKFNEYLLKEKWTKTNLTTTWYAKFTEGVEIENAIQTTKRDVKGAAAYAGISHYEAAVEAGYSAPMIWNQSA